MEMAAGFLFAIVAFYIAFVLLLSNAVRSKTGGHNPFWWVFFLGIIGAVIVILLDIRDNLPKTDLQE